MAYTILIVDDTESNRYVMAHALRAQGWNILEAVSGGQALQVIDTCPVDLIVLDIQLPDISGREICQRLKSHSATRGILIVHTSAHFTNSESRSAGLDAGADGYVNQPIHVPEFLATVRSLLRLRDTERSSVRKDEKYKALVEATSQAVMMLDGSGKLIEDIGFSALVGSSIDKERIDEWLTIFSMADRLRLQPSWKHARREHSFWEGAGWVHTAYGSRICLEIRLVPLPYRADDSSLEWVGTVRDMTYSRKTADAAVDQLKKLERSNESLAHFAHVLAHDLQSPARLISNYIDLVLRNPTMQIDERGKRHLSIINDGTARIRKLIDGILRYSTITNSSNFEEVSLQDAMRDVQKNMSHLIDEKHAVLTWGVLPTVRADRVQIEQLFENLISNALKYCTNPVPTVDIATHTDSSSVIITFTDNGIGIDELHRQEIFTLFNRLHSTHYEGFGIGLSLCRRIVENHGGSIDVSSQVGSGSTFTVKMPIGVLCLTTSH